ncbi:MAG: thioredoxin domain-containing protein [Candidatus Fermentibacterota bacterium]
MNHLAGESSPYLLQHADNPVDWRPWGDEAFRLAAELDRPLFVSIGYSTCHWCHVMAEESFEDARVAGLMNESFVCVKVDREERPDVDSLYMRAAQAMTGRGGWPLNVILTPERRPFYAATYVPRQAGPGRMGMLELLPAIAGAWSRRRPVVEEAAARMTAALEPESHREDSGLRMDAEMAEGAREELAQRFDEAHGGFGRAPKFPMPHVLLFLVRHHGRTGHGPSLEMAIRTLRAIRRGGVFDQVGHGVHRYSTDAAWHLPHFEKMLYDQALLALAAVEAREASGDPAMRGLAEDVLDYVLRDLRHPEGGFCSAEDADSPGGEGAFYTWTAGELEALLSPDEYLLAEKYWGVEESGNYREEATGRPSGRNVLDAGAAPEPSADDARGLDGLRRSLMRTRSERPRPALDDKVLTDWNGLAIAALARAGSSFGREDYLRAAGEAADFVEDRLRDGGGRLLHRWREGRAGIEAFADDIAFLAWGLLELHQATQDHRRLERAMDLMDDLEDRFGSEGGALYSISAADSQLPARPREIGDGALPSANSVTLQNLHRLWRLTGRPRFRKRLDGLLAEYAPYAAAAPSAHAMAMAALEEMLSPQVDVVVCGEGNDPAASALLKAARQLSRGSAMVLLREPGDTLLPRLAPHVADTNPVEGRAAAYVCRGFACGLPVTGTDELRELLTGRDDRAPSLR